MLLVATSRAEEHGADRRSRLGRRAREQPYHARFPGGAFSIASSTAPPIRRQAKALAEAAGARSAGAVTPIAAYVEEANGHRGDAHRQQCGNQRRFAADPVAEMAEERRADRARDERIPTGERRELPTQDRSREEQAGEDEMPRSRRCRSRRLNRRAIRSEQHCPGLFTGLSTTAWFVVTTSVLASALAASMCRPAL